MWNHVAARVDTSLGVDQLADELLAELSSDEDTSDEELVGSEATAGLCQERGFRRLVEAFGRHLAKQDIGDPEAERVVSRCNLDGIRQGEVEAFASQQSTPSQRLIRDAVVLARVVRAGQNVADRMDAIGLDLIQLEEQGVEELMRDMTAAARSLFAQSRYDESFGVSEVKAGNLLSLIRPKPKSEQEASAATPRRRWWNLSMSTDSRLPLGVPVKLVGMVLGFGLLIPALSSLESDVSVLSPEKLSQISPFLESGQHRIHDFSPSFVGELGPTWDYLGTSDRGAVALEIARHFSAYDIHTTILLGAGPREMARVENGELVALVARPAASRR